MPGQTFILPVAAYPDLRPLVKGQTAKLQMGVEVVGTDQNNVMLALRTLKVGSKSKMSTQDILLAGVNEKLNTLVNVIPKSETRV